MASETDIRSHNLLPVPLVRRGPLLIAALAVMAVMTLLIAVGIGASAIAPGDVLTSLGGWITGEATNGTQDVIIRFVRLPRVVVVALSGAALGVTGVYMQGLFRNPLADPGLIGISGGAGLAATVMIVLGDRLLPLGVMAWVPLPLAAFGGALMATLLIMRIAGCGGGTSVPLLLLGGIAIGALASAGTGFLVFMADDRQLRDISFWMLGSFGGANWTKVSGALVWLCLPLIAMPFLARALDALAFGEAEAFHLGIPVERTKRLIVVLTALAVGTCVAVAGSVSFIGIVVPHVTRLIIGPRHHSLLPSSALVGMICLTLADTAARTLAVPAELPLGVLTALIGAPIFLHLLLTQRSQM